MSTKLEARLSRYKRGVMSDSEAQWFETRSCVQKIRYPIEPICTMDQRAYPCPFCKGWHKTSKRQ